jgi:hypothetical protein
MSKPQPKAPETAVETAVESVVQDETGTKAYSNLFNCIEVATFEMLKLYFNEYDVQKCETVGKHRYFQEMSAIHISGENLKIQLKVLYMSGAWESMRPQVEERPNGERAITTYFKEFCNLVAGKLKKVFLNENIFIGYSVPVSVPGFSNIFFSIRDKQSEIFEWNVSISNQIIHFEVRANMADVVMPQVARLSVETDEKEGDVTFF